MPACLQVSNIDLKAVACIVLVHKRAPQCSCQTPAVHRKALSPSLYPSCFPNCLYQQDVAYLATVDFPLPGCPFIRMSRGGGRSSKAAMATGKSLSVYSLPREVLLFAARSTGDWSALIRWGARLRCFYRNRAQSVGASCCTHARLARWFFIWLAMLCGTPARLLSMKGARRNSPHAI